MGDALWAPRKFQGGGGKVSDTAGGKHSIIGDEVTEGGGKTWGGEIMMRDSRQKAR